MFLKCSDTIFLQWITTASIVSAVCLSMGGCWAVIQLYSEPWVKMLAVGAELLVVYISLRCGNVSRICLFITTGKVYYGRAVPTSRKESTDKLD